MINVHYYSLDGYGKVVEVGNTDQESFAVMKVNNPKLMAYDARGGTLELDDYFENGIFYRPGPGAAYVDGMTIKNLPIPCAVSVDSNDKVQVTDGELTLNVTAPGTYIVEIFSPKVRFQRLEIYKPWN